MSDSQFEECSQLTRNEHLFDRLRLAAIPGLGPILRRRLIGQFGSASEVLQASVASLESIHGVGRHLASAISMSSTHDKASRILDDCQQHGIDIVLDTDPVFPELLSQI
ncbi:MAG: helix-hairpin-helix domain-containing protein, partial [Pirellulales bacterium]